MSRSTPVRAVAAPGAREPSSAACNRLFRRRWMPDLNSRRLGICGFFTADMHLNSIRL